MDILKRICETPELLEVARRAIEDALISMRDSRIQVLRNNGCSIREMDGSPSSIVRMGHEQAMRVGLEAIIKHLEASQ